MDLTFQSYIEFGTFSLTLYLGYSGIKWWSVGLLNCIVKALFSLITFDEVSRSFLFSNPIFLFTILGWFVQGMIGWFIGNYFRGSLHKRVDTKREAYRRSK